MREDLTREERPELEYVKPAVADYGDLQKLTAATVHGGHTDVPSGTPAPAVFS
jgi:hypothetical protein